MAIASEQIIHKYQSSAPQRVVSAIARAAKATGADFSLLMDKASAESDFNPAAKAKGSSATGLFQFIDSTWLSMVKEHGAKYGLSAYADKIEMKNGKPCCTDASVKSKILDLRKNPEISALMAGELTQDNREYLESRGVDDVGKTEMYLAHFMGAGGAAKFLTARDKSGTLAGASLFPREAHANKSVFFDAAGRPRTLDQIYDRFARKFGEDGGSTAVASAKKVSTGMPSHSVTPAPASDVTVAQSLTPSPAQRIPSMRPAVMAAQAHPFYTAVPATTYDGAAHPLTARMSSDMMLMLMEMRHNAIS